ncbi:hypothetical protein WJX74_000603 [Apatococcus lobatus]|uniref:PCI domain-containing protein n=2 Tax=Apatococcus TaxID=904362 RepID=A0AAW1T5V9_9CHLO
MESEAQLEQFCILAKGTKGRAIADLIQRATSQPSIFTFGELLDIPSVKELPQTEYAAAYELLQLFAYGTWQDYREHQGKISLNSQQELKLKLLTVATMAGTSSMLRYKDLMQQLEIGNLRELEDLLITECFYGGIISGKLDQRARCLHVHSALGRDVRPQQLRAIRHGLDKWLEGTNAMLETIESNVRQSQAAAADSAKAKAQHQSKLEELQKKLKTEADAGSKDSMMLDDPSMDMMEEDRIGPGSMPAMRSKRRR